MKKYRLIVILLFLSFFHFTASKVQAACSWTLSPSGGAYTIASSCGVDAQSSEYYDYSSAADDAANGYVVTVPTGVTLTINSGISSTPTRLAIGKILLTGGTVSIGSTYANILIGQKCYVLDSDGDTYSPSPSTCVTTYAAGYIRKNKLTSTTADCYDSNANAKPGQTTYYTTNRGDSSFDYNCDSAATKQSTTTYTCAACTNGSGYGSYAATSGGWTTSGGPACGVSETYYTVTSATCADPAVANCSASVTTATQTMACR